MEHAKHRTCEECGESFEPGGISQGSVCPTCNAIFLRRIGKRLLIAAAQATVVTPILFTGFFLFNEAVLIGFWEAFKWRKVVGFWEELELSRIVLPWAFITFLSLLPGGFWGGGGGDGGNGGNGGNGGGGVGD